MVQAYRSRWAGYVVHESQALDWPRYEVRRPGRWSFIESDVVPVEVTNACAELALKTTSADLTPDQSQAVKERTVGPITTVYADGSKTTKSYPAIDRMLSGLFGAGGIPIVRG